MAGRVNDCDAYKRVVDAVARLDEATRRAENTHIGARRVRTTVTIELLRRLANSKHASSELRAFALSVAAGDTDWDRIELDARPVPPEVSELRADPLVEWPRDWPLQSNEEPYRIPWQ